MEQNPGRNKNNDEKKRILLVEDYQANILVATTFLDDFGYIYETATSGPEAIEKFFGGKFAAVLMDIQMQGMDGFETTSQIRALEKSRGLAPTPIIAMTAHSLADDKERCIAGGMDDYISKPFDPLVFRDKLAHHTSRQASSESAEAN